MRCWRMCLVLAMVPGSLQAQGPLTIEQLLVDASRWQIVSAYELRSAAGAGGLSQESTAWSTALRYGASNRLELSARIGGQDLRVGNVTFDTRQKLNSVSLGVNWLAHREGALPALLLELNADAVSDAQDRGVSFAGTQWAVTTYRTIDPLVLSLTLSGRREQARHREDLRVQPGSTYGANARVSFAVNPRVTLFGGLSLQSYSATRVDGQRLASPPMAIGVNGGFAFAPSLRHTVFVDADVAPQAGASGLSVRWFMQF